MKMTKLVGLFLAAVFAAGAWATPTLPTLPQATVDTTYALPTGGIDHTPANSANLTTLLTGGTLAGQTLQLGDTITLTVGTTYTGTFTLPNLTTQRGGTSSTWIYIKSSALASLPAAGTRVAPADATNMPKIISSGGSSYAIDTVAKSHHFRFVGIEIKPVNDSTYVTALVNIGNGESSTANLPHDITFDRCYIHSAATAGGRRGLAFNAINAALVENYIADFKENGSDSQGSWFYNTPGPIKVHNNYLEASAENMMFGGTDPDVTNLVPSDITITRNYFKKPTAWTSLSWWIKNLLEFKNAQRVLVEGNTFENNWADQQHGEAIVITPRNQEGSCNWCVTQDITIRLNRFINLGDGINISGRDDVNTSQITHRILIEHNEIGITRFNGSDGRIFQFTNGPTDITVRHITGLITVAGGATGFTESTPDVDQFSFGDSIVTAGSIGFGGTLTTEGTNTLNTYFTNYSFTSNAIIGSSGTYPAGNSFPANTTAVGFVNYAGGNYRLAGGSSFKAGAANDATDNTDLGANIDLIDAAIAGTGGGTVTYMPIRQ